MKTIRFIPKVRSNSVSSTRMYTNHAVSLFDSTSPTASRPSRLSIEGKPAQVEGAQNSQHNSHSHPPFSLALAQPNAPVPQGQYALFPYSSFASSSPHPTTSPQPQPQDSLPHPRPKRQRLMYQLDVGAYGIPKRCRSKRQHIRHYSSSQDSHLAVQVGEDAYFVRDNAMGVADGVGGWAKSLSNSTSSSSSSPSALFAKRLMHYCSAEVENAVTIPTPPIDSSSSTTSTTPGSSSPPSRPQFSFTHHLKPRTSSSLAHSPWQWSDPSLLSTSTSLPASFTLHDTFAKRDKDWERQEEYEYDHEQDLEDSLEELSEGIDVLQILESAYDKTLKAHVVPSNTESSTSPNSTLSNSNSKQTENCTPLLSGSSTALLAVLDHPPRPQQPQAQQAAASSTTVSGLGSVSTSTSGNGTPSTPGESLLDATATATTSTSASTSSSRLNSTSSSSGPGLASALGCELEECESLMEEEKGEYDAVIKIAHLGDSMGMLIRGEEIVWRSEEMWWDFNTPVQLGPSTSNTVTPRNSARVFTVPVKADDILILASDGLSDNLWDEDVLDEVVRFKQAFLKDGNGEVEVEDSGYSSGSSWDGDLSSMKKKSSTPMVTSSPLSTSSSSSSSSSSPISSTPTSTSSSNSKPTSATSQGQSQGQGTKTQIVGEGLLKRKTLAGMLSEALCSRARRISERRPSSLSKSSITTTTSTSSTSMYMNKEEIEDEVPFARRAREAGRRFSGGKNDDISVVVAVISPLAKC